MYSACLVKKRIPNVLLFCSLVLLANFATAQEARDIKLFLPIEKHAYPKMVKKFRQYLDAQKLSSIKIVTAEHWHGYQHGIRAGRKGVYFAAPHFAAWANHKHGFKPWLRLSSPISYVIAARQNDRDIFEMNDLANLPVCARKPLNLDYLLINAAFDNPLLSAEIRVVPSVVEEMRRSLSKCRGFAINNQQYRQLATIFPDRFIRLQQSQRFNNYALIVAPQLADEQQEVLTLLSRALSAEAGRKVLEPLLQQYSDEPAWVPAKSTDYPEVYFRKLLRFW